jgi:hypothetical protein
MEDCGNDYDFAPDRWYWLRRAIAIEDTLAQWIMMTFTVAAAVLLFGTLRATQEMAADTRQIGKDQLRPWVLAGGLSVEQIQSELGISQIARIEWKNFGNSPAIETKTIAMARVVAKDAPFEPFEVDYLSHGVAIPPDASNFTPDITLWADCFDSFHRGELDWIIFGRIEYQHALNPTAGSFAEIVFRVRRDGEENNQSGDRTPRYIKSVEMSEIGER